VFPIEHFLIPIPTFMQLLDSSVARLLDDLQDIVNNVQIKSNFCISHPNYKPMELPAEVLTRFQPLPLTFAISI
jgi:hypothetical protein